MQPVLGPLDRTRPGGELPLLVVQHGHRDGDYIKKTKRKGQGTVRKLAPTNGKRQVNWRKSNVKDYVDPRSLGRDVDALPSESNLQAGAIGPDAF